MQAETCCHFEWALTVPLGYQFQPELSMGTTHCGSFCLEEHRGGAMLPLTSVRALERLHLIPLILLCQLFFH